MTSVIEKRLAKVERASSGGGGFIDILKGLDQQRREREAFLADAPADELERDLARLDREEQAGTAARAAYEANPPPAEPPRAAGKRAARKLSLVEVLASFSPASEPPPDARAVERSTDAERAEVVRALAARLWVQDPDAAAIVAQARACGRPMAAAISSLLRSGDTRH